MPASCATAKWHVPSPVWAPNRRERLTAPWWEEALARPGARAVPIAR